MDQTTARLLLGIDPDSTSGQIEIAIEEAVFSEATFFMRRAFIPKLAEVRINKLSKIAMAAAEMELPFAQAKPQDQEYREGELIEAGDFIVLLSVYNRLETSLKLKIINSENPFELMQLYRYWKNYFSNYRIKYIQLFENMSVQNLFAAEKVTQAYQVDFNELISEIQEGNYGFTVYKEYRRLVNMSD